MSSADYWTVQLATIASTKESDFDECASHQLTESLSLLLKNCLEYH